MIVATGPTPPLLHRHRAIHADTDASFKFFVDCIKGDPRLRGRVLDVGCGERPSIITVGALFPLYQLAASLDGLDPFPGVASHPWMEHAWVGEVEKVQLPTEAYDAVLAINVPEHIAEPVPFLRAISRTLKPGGVIYAITPHAHHPFAWSVRLIQAINLKRSMAAGNAEFNDYPAYYRLNSRSAVEHAGRAAGYATARVFYHPHTHWRTYLPRLMRPAGWLYDATLGVHVLSAGQQFMFMLEKPGTGAGTVLPPRTSKVFHTAPVAPARAHVPAPSAPPS